MANLGNSFLAFLTGLTILFFLSTPSTSSAIGILISRIFRKNPPQGHLQNGVRNNRVSHSSQHSSCINGVSSHLPFEAFEQMTLTALVGAFSASIGCPTRQPLGMGQMHPLAFDG
uniref:Uncharacterized protein n=1 Tax=Romanomermis culicivorax TaxID=13658 RepID=A0A915K279_ROMCU